MIRLWIFRNVVKVMILEQFQRIVICDYIKQFIFVILILFLVLLEMVSGVIFDDFNGFILMVLVFVFGFRLIYYKSSQKQYLKGLLGYFYYVLEVILEGIKLY